MISSIFFRNFKCFDNCDIPIKGLTVLAGANGCGKSTVIQSILLVKQSFEKYRGIDKIIVSGEYINLGTTSDIINEYTEDEYIQLKFQNENSKCLLINIPYESNMNLVNVTSNMSEINEKEFNIISDSFEYIAADRISPQNIYGAINFSRNLGIHGEKAFSYLSLYGSEEVISEMRESGVAEGLIFQTNEWLSRMFHGFKFTTLELPIADSIGLRYQEVSKTNSSNDYRPINVGFGITYVLPVIVALLKAKKGDLVIIENPECHLHPKAQRLIGELIAKAVNAGIQVILETHSDHVLNGIRVSVKHGIVDCNKVQILFFDREDVGKRFNTNVYAPNILSDGSLDYWPVGFFDEWDNALTELF